MIKKIIITVLSILLFAGVVVGGYFGYKILSEKNPPDAGTLGTEQKGDYKDFTVTDVNGKEVKLSDFIGKPIVINFWASWCGPCRSELPAFDKAAKENKGQVHFLMVNLLSGETETKVKEFARKENYSFPLYFDNTGTAASAYNVSSIPVTVFIDAQGKVRKSQVGAMSEIVLKSYVAELLKQGG